jgi:hypothetical protein
MAAFADYKDADFEAALPATVQIMRIITGAMCMGLFMLAAVTALLYFQNPRKEVPADFVGILPVLSAVHAVVALMGYAVGWFICEQQFKPENMAKAKTPLEVIQTAHIVKWASREGGALIGLVACLLCVTTGIVAHHPAFLLNGVSAVVFWGVAANDFPSAERCRDIYRTKIQGR